ncbi:MAG TPA: hypothetical protein VGC55_12165 [Dokdonella sp.]
MSKIHTWFLAASACALIAAPAWPAAAAAGSDSPGGDPLGVFDGTGLAGQIRGRTRIDTQVSGILAFPDPHEGATWYVDPLARIAGTRDGMMRVEQGHLVHLTGADDRRYRRDIARRVNVPVAQQWVLGDGKPQGKRDLILVTAYDCEACSELQERLKANQAKLNVRLHFVFGVVDADADDAKQTLRDIQCAKKPIEAYGQAAGENALAHAPRCDIPAFAGGYVATLLNAPYYPSVFDRESGEMVGTDARQTDRFVSELNGVAHR